MAALTYELVKENDRLPARFDIVRVAPSTIPAHWHKYVEILYLLSGKMTAVIQAETYTLSAGDILIINSEDIHMTQTYGKRTEYILLQISATQLGTFFSDFHLLRFNTYIPHMDCTLSDFTRTELAQTKLAQTKLAQTKLAQTKLAPTQPANEVLAHIDSSQLDLPQTDSTPSFYLNPDLSFYPGLYLEQMLSIYETQADGYPLLFSARLHELLYCLYRQYSRWLTPGAHSSTHRNFSRIAQVLDWIQKHYAEPLTLNEAASHVGFSREYFCRLFREYTGQTFLEYLNGVRAMNLHEDLFRSDDNITTLMARHGITNYKVFLHTFRTLYGDTPQKLRKQRAAVSAAVQK